MAGFTVYAPKAQKERGEFTTLDTAAAFCRENSERPLAVVRTTMDRDPRGEPLERYETVVQFS